MEQNKSFVKRQPNDVWIIFRENSKYNQRREKDKCILTPAQIA